MVLPHLRPISLQFRTKIRHAVKCTLNCCELQVIFRSERKLSNMSSLGLLWHFWVVLVNCCLFRVSLGLLFDRLCLFWVVLAPFGGFLGCFESF